MAKCRVNPEQFRAGITKSWPDGCKLSFYEQDIALLNNINLKVDGSQLLLKDFFVSRRLNCKIKKISRRRQFKVNGGSFQSWKIFSQVRRRNFVYLGYYFFPYPYYPQSHFQPKPHWEPYTSISLWYDKFLPLRKSWVAKQKRALKRARRMAKRKQFKKYFKYNNSHHKFNRRHNYNNKYNYKYKNNYKKKKRKIKKNQKTGVISTWLSYYDLKNIAQFELFLKFKNFLNDQNLKIQHGLPYNFKLKLFNSLTTTAGSSSLRRYQFNISAVKPPQWMFVIRLARYSFKKSVGYLLTRSDQMNQFKHSGVSRVLLSQLNIAVHWRSSVLFALVVRRILEQKNHKVSGFLRHFRGIIYRLFDRRLGIRAIFLTVSGSFGKMTRTRAIRIGSTMDTKNSLTKLTNSVNFANAQARTRRGVLGVRVWFFNVV